MSNKMYKSYKYRGVVFMKVSLKEIEELFKKMEEKINWTSELKETINKNNCNNKNAISLEPLEKEINNIKEKVKLIKENVVIEIDEDISVIYESLKKKAKPKGQKILSKEDKDIKEKIEKAKKEINDALEILNKRVE